MASPFKVFREFIFGPSDPCKGIKTFQDLIADLSSSSEQKRSQAVRCIINRNMSIARQEAQSWRPNYQNNAIDALTDVVLDVCERIASGRLSLESEQAMGGYIREAVRNKLKTYYKKDIRNPLLDAQDISELFDLTDIGIESAHDRLIIDQAIALELKKLSTDCQYKVIMWHNDYSHREIALTQEITEKSAKNAVFRCIKQLRELLRANESYRQIIERIDKRNAASKSKPPAEEDISGEEPDEESDLQ